jgi:branched-chain amino acid transport system ATP-binding protein
MAIQKINQLGTTVLLVEQNVIESLELASRAYILQSGQITMQGTGKELLKSDVVRASFLGF